MTHDPDCNGYHTSCIECSDPDNLNVCVTEFGAPDFCADESTNTTSSVSTGLHAGRLLRGESYEQLHRQ